MRIATKINAVLAAAFACGALASVAVLDSTIRPRFDEIEQSMARANHVRVTEAFDTFTEKLETAAQDYGFWDETYAFMQGENAEDFVKSNMTPAFSALQNLGVNALVFLGKDGKVKWGEAFDLETKEPIEGLVKEIAHFARSRPHLARKAEDTPRGLLHTSKGLVLVSISPAMKSDRTGDPFGKVIAASLLDVQAAKELTGVDFKVEERGDGRAFAGLSSEIQLKTLADSIETVSVLNNVVGRPLAVLTATSSREVSHTGHAALRSAMTMMLAAGFLSLCVMWAFLRNTVIAPLTSLSRHFETAGSSGKIAPATLTNGDDEIRNLGQSFNGMADQVNGLRDALADSAYMSGLSEWAAGTLHNVRNGLAPATAMMWQVEKLYDGNWLKNIETAVAEVADGKTPDERRVKLNTFLAGSASRLLHAAKETSTLASSINESNRSVLNMVAEFERYTHRKTELENVDLLPLISASAASVLAARSDRVEIVLPKNPASVQSNGIILRQVMANILINAAEAMESCDRLGRIEISIEQINVKGAAFSRISVADNGEGLTPERLTNIFKRGGSTRRPNSGGLGLHWCANAITVLGGNIRAESAGHGHGATLIIELPNSVTKLKEVA